MHWAVGVCGRAMHQCVCAARSNTLARSEKEEDGKSVCICAAIHIIIAYRPAKASSSHNNLTATVE